MAHNASGRLAQQALELTRNKLLVSLRFMNAAFAHLKLLAQPGQTIATDGTYLRYSPADVARAFASSPEELARAYLHIMLHDVFLHPFPNPNMVAAAAAVSIMGRRRVEIRAGVRRCRRRFAGCGVVGHGRG